MRAICVDDERILAEELAAMCMELPEIHEVRSFVWASDALEWLENNPVDLALLQPFRPSVRAAIAAAAGIKHFFVNMSLGLLLRFLGVVLQEMLRG